MQHELSSIVVKLSANRSAELPVICSKITSENHYVDWQTHPESLYDSLSEFI